MDRWCTPHNLSRCNHIFLVWAHAFLVPVPQFLAAFSSVQFIPFSSVIFSTVRSARSTVPKNANHRKTCNVLYGTWIIIFLNFLGNLDKIHVHIKFQTSEFFDGSASQTRRRGCYSRDLANSKVHTRDRRGTPQGLVPRCYACLTCYMNVSRDSLVCISQ
jgi:hypothetical protein